MPSGATSAPNQADYGQDHVRRLRLVRVLREVGELSIDAIREIVEAIEDPSRPLHAVLGVAHRAVSPFATEEDGASEELAAVDGLLERLGWQVSADAPDRHGLAKALSSLRGLGYEIDADVFVPYAKAADRIAAVEVGGFNAEASRDEAVEYTVVGTVVYGAALTALRRLAQEHHSAQRDT